MLNIINFLWEIVKLLYNGIVTLVNLILQIPYYINAYVNSISYLNFFGSSYSIIFTIFITVMFVHVAIKIKRLII